MTPELLEELVTELENVKLSLGDGNKKLLEEKLARFKMGKKIISSKDLSKGTKLTIEDLLFKSGEYSSEIDKVLEENNKGLSIRRKY